MKWRPRAERTRRYVAMLMASRYGKNQSGQNDPSRPSIAVTLAMSRMRPSCSIWQMRELPKKGPSVSWVRQWWLVKRHHLNYNSLGIEQTFSYTVEISLCAIFVSWKDVITWCGQNVPFFPRQIRFPGGWQNFLWFTYNKQYILVFLKIHQKLKWQGKLPVLRRILSSSVRKVIWTPDILSLGDVSNMALVALIKVIPPLFPRTWIATKNSVKINVCWFTPCHTHVKCVACFTSRDYSISTQWCLTTKSSRPDVMITRCVVLI